jgi:hypothetical protein
MRKFTAKNATFGDHFLIDSGGNLQYWDRDGLVETRAKK